jgi:hypothetical protein
MYLLSGYNVSYASVPVTPSVRSSYRPAVVIVNRRYAAGLALPASGFYFEEMTECIKGHVLLEKLI